MNKKTERKQNLRLVIESLRRFGPMTQAGLKDHLGLQASTVSYLVNDLKKVDMVVDLGLANQPGKVGKPGNLIQLNNKEAQFLGIYAEDDRLHIYLVGIDGFTFSVDTLNFDSAGVEEAIFSAVSGALGAHPNIKGVGLTMKAVVYHNGTIKSGVRLGAKKESQGWDLAGLPAKLRRTFPQMPIVVENDANCAAELYQYENRTKTGNLVVYLLNKNPFGIGLGLMIGGQIFRGATGAAGEFFEMHTKIRDVGRSIQDEADFVARFMPAILPHVLETAFMIDPDCIVLSGSYFEEIAPKSVAQIEQLCRQAPMPVFVAGGENRLNPAKGVALLAAHDYISSFVEEVAKR